MKQQEINFSHEMLPELFLNIRKGRNGNSFDSNYIVTAAKGDIAEISFLGRGEWRFFIDNFPQQKKFYQTNFPMVNVYRFIEEMSLIGIPLERNPDKIDMYDPHMHAVITRNELMKLNNK